VRVEAIRCADRFGKRQQHRVGERRAQLIQRHSGGQVRADRGEDISSVEGAADVLQPVARLVKRYEVCLLPGSAGGFDERGEDAVIGTHKVLTAQLRRHGSPAGSHTWVDNCDMHRARREEWRRARQGNGAFQHILRGDPMADVGDLRGGADAPDDALHRSDKAVFVPEI